MKRISKRTKAAISAMMALVLIAATWAYFTSTSEIDNKLKTDVYGIETIEKFTPEQTIVPGATVEKNVGVKNTGDYGVVVRIRLDEKWERGGTPFIAISSVADDDTFNGAIDSAEKDDITGKVTSEQTSYIDGLVTDDESVMYKNLIGLVGGAASPWVKGNDGYYYYRSVLNAKNTTSLLIDEIIFAGDADLGLQGTPVEKYSTADPDVIAPLQLAFDSALADYEADPDDAALKTALEDAEGDLELAYAWDTTPPADARDITFQKVVSAIDDTAGGYSGAEYTLTIITQVCQATAEAVDAEWADMDEDVKDAWELQ